MAVVARRGRDWLRLLAWALPAIAGLGVAAAVAAPVLSTAPKPLRLWGAVTYLAFHPACHQQPDRCLWVAGAPMALCARCTVLYTGFALIGFVSQFSLRPVPHAVRLRLFGLALGLMLLDVASEVLGLRGPFLPTRLLTGALVGAAGAWLIVPALRAAESLDSEVTPRTKSCHTPHRTSTQPQGGGIHVTH